MALLGNPSARFPNECRLRTVITTIKLPTDDRARPSIACVRAQAAAAGLARLRCHGCADAPKGLSQPLSVCVAPQRPSPATKYRALSLPRPLPLSLLFSLSPPSSLHTKPTPSHTQTLTHITMSTRSTRKRKNEEEELVELPEDSDAESEEE